jgi:hypothetical protein
LIAVAPLLILALARPTLAQQGDLPKPELDPGFKPVLVSVDFTSRTVRPGDLVGVTYRFKNEGTREASSDHMVFVHLEWPDADCKDIVLGMDHPPSRATSAWEPGETISDGPYVFPAPTEHDGVSYHVHVGIFAPDLGGARLLEEYAGELKVDSNAPPTSMSYPAPLSEEDKRLRRKALTTRIKSGVSIEEPKYHFTVDKDSGAWQIIDKVSDTVWTSDLEQPVFGEIEMSDGKVMRTWPIRKFDEIAKVGKGVRLTTLPKVGATPTGLKVVFAVTPVKDPAGLNIQYTAGGAGPWRVTSVKILDHALGTTDDDAGYSILPDRLGVLDRADSGLPSIHRYQTYANTSMAMYGAVKRGGAILVAWPHPDTMLEFSKTWPEGDLVAGRRMNSISLILRGASDSCSIYPLGDGTYSDIALAYRKVAQERGLTKTWAQKRKACPNVDKLIGAADFKPFVFGRSVPSTPGGKSSTSMGFSFDETAQCAEHWSRDLGIDRAMVVLAGWIHRGYDNQHPDILPACPECGGNDELAKAAARIKDTGFLFGLHDNYQDMYKDAPSWDEKYINRDAHGNLKMGGFWAGGQSYQVCAIEQVKLAQRPQNLPEVQRLFGPTIYFIDTVFAWPLVTCEAKDHPMTLADDMKYKSLLCDEARKHFGLMGSEEGREWAAAHADYMEGIFGAKASGDPRQIVVPIFPMVYGDSTMLYTHQSDRLNAGDTKRFLDHIIYAAMPVYNFGEHLYWKQPSAQGVPIVPLAPTVEAAGERKFNITYHWQVNGKIGEDLGCFVHFVQTGATRAEGIAYQGDHQFAVPSSQWQPGTVVDDGPYTVEVPAGALGKSEVLVGLLTKDGGRVALDKLQSNAGRYNLGTVNVTDAGITFTPTEIAANTVSFAKPEGWAKGLCETDRFIKNTYEVLSHLQRLTAEHPMIHHEFLTADRSVERSRFGGDVEVTVNYGPRTYSVGDTVLPANGFLIESPTFVAFHAQRYGGRVYDPTAMFTIRSLDGKPIAASKRIRIFHAFGDPRVSVNGKEYSVDRESVVGG